VIEKLDEAVRLTNGICTLSAAGERRPDAPYAARRIQARDRIYEM
jgi:hypothetical protein